MTDQTAKPLLQLNHGPWKFEVTTTFRAHDRQLTVGVVSRNDEDPDPFLPYVADRWVVTNINEARSAERLGSGSSIADPHERHDDSGFRLVDGLDHRLDAVDVTLSWPRLGLSVTVTALLDEGPRRGETGPGQVPPEQDPAWNSPRWS